MKRRARFILVLRFLYSQPLHTGTLIAVFLIALAGSLIFSEVAVRRNNRLTELIAQSYGTVSVRPAKSENRIDYPHIGHLPDANTGWITPELYEGVTELAAALDLAIAPRIRGSVVEPEGEATAFLARYEGDWGERDSVADPPDSPPLRIAVQESEHLIRFLPVPERAIAGYHPTPSHLWLNARWLVERLEMGDRPSPPATEIAVRATGDPFALAFDLRELLEDRGLSAEVRAWGEFLGAEGYAATRTGAAVEQFLILVVSVLAIAGVTSVSVHNRTDVTVLLRTVGLSDDTIRRVYLLELFTLACLAVLAAGLVLLVAHAISVLEMPPEMIRRTLLLGVTMPPFTGFFSVRRQLRHPLRVMRREALR